MLEEKKQNNNISAESVAEEITVYDGKEIDGVVNDKREELSLKRLKYSILEDPFVAAVYKLRLKGYGEEKIYKALKDNPDFSYKDITHPLIYKTLYRVNDYCKRSESLDKEYFRKKIFTDLTMMNMIAWQEERYDLALETYKHMEDILGLKVNKTEIGGIDGRPIELQAVPFSIAERDERIAELLKRAGENRTVEPAGSPEQHEVETPAEAKTSIS
jgi:hypothetical protein